MAQLIVRNLEDDVRDRLRELARSRGQNMEEMVREILRRAVQIPAEPRQRLGSSIAARFGATGLTRPIEELRGNEISPPSFKR